MRMRFQWAAAIVSAFLAGVPAASAQSQWDAGQLTPERRAVMIPDTDLPGGDLESVFDTTLSACVERCVANDQCVAFTYNQNSRACFPKSDGAGAPAAFLGALSGRLSPVEAPNAKARADALPDLSPEDVSAARSLAERIAVENLPSPEPDLASRITQAEASGDLRVGMDLASQMVAIRDTSDDWTTLARIILFIPDEGGDAGMAGAAALNGYLRALDDAEAGRALQWLALAWDRNGRGPSSLKALRLAATLLPGDSAVTEALQKAEDRYGFRVSDNSVDNAGVTPRLCVQFSENLAQGVDYAPFVRSDVQGLAIDANGSQLCASGLAFGQQVKLTLRAGLPAESGEKLAKDSEVTTYIRDRQPSVSFPGRGYILPSGGDQGLAMVTVNTDRVKMTLSRLADRNLIRVIEDEKFAVPLDQWEASYFSNDMVTKVWSGTADVAKPVGQDVLNKDVTTRLAIPAEVGPLPPGIYIVQARLDGPDDDETGLATQWFVISDFGISTLAGTDGLTVAVRGLADAGPKAGAEVTLLSRANDVLGRTVTDAEGVARFADGLMRGQGGAEPALVSVSQWQGDGADRHPTDMAFLSLTAPEFDLSDRGVEGAPPAPAIDVFVTTDRGAYRAGETVNATILSRDTVSKAIDGLPLTAVILRPDGVEQSRQQPQAAGAGGYTLAWDIPTNAPRGTWQIQLRAEADGDALAKTTLLVEDFLPERIDFTPDIPPGPANPGTALPVELTARWLFGAPAADLPVEGSLRYTRAGSLPGYDGYSFRRHDDETRADTLELPAGTTDAQGHYASSVDLPNDGALGGQPYDATIILSVREGAGRPVERIEKRLILPAAAPVIGVKPDFDGGAVNEGTQAGFQIVALDAGLKPVAAKVKWTLNRIDTRYQWYSIDGQWNWDPITTRTQITNGTMDTGAEPVAIKADVDWGEYELVVAPENGPGGASLNFWAGWGAAASGGTDTPDRLTVTLDKPAYQSGDTAQVTVDAQSAGTGVVSVLSNRVVSLQMVDLTAGENRISLPVTDDWGAGVYVTVSAIRPLAGIKPGDRTPVRTLGLAHAAVDPGARKLQATLTVPAQSRPRGTIPVELAVQGGKAGETVHATIAAVDQGILNLTAFKSPDPSQHYFGQRRLGVALRDLYGRLILPSGAADGALREGGDAQMSASSDAPPPTEKLMSWFSGPLTLDADGKVSVDVPVPDFNGEVRVMAVVWSDTAVGQAEAVAPVRDPVVMTVTAPRFLAPGDVARVSMRLTHVDGPTGEVGVSIADAGDTTLSPGALSGPVNLTEHGEAQVSVPLTAGPASGTGRLTLSLTLPDGGVVTKDITVPVALNEPDTIRMAEATLAPGQSMIVPANLLAGLQPGATVNAASGDFARLDVATQLARLQRYPYGCTEQVASVAMPLLYVPQLAQLSSGRDENTTLTVDKAIQTVLSRQGANGGFGLWSAGSGDLWLEAYATDFLSRARATGHNVPDAPYRAAIARLQTQANNATDPQSADPYDNAALAYAVAVLARERAATVGDLRYYADTAAEAFSTPMASALLGSALAQSGDPARADRLFQQSMVQIARNMSDPEKPVYRADYGTRLRDEAAVLALSAEVGSTAVDRAALVRDVATGNAENTRKGWSPSTQEAVWTILAAESLSKTATPVTLNGAALDSAVIPLPVPQSDVLANAGNADAVLRFTAMGKPVDPPHAGGQGYRITREYYDLDGSPVDPALVGQGTRMVVVLSVSALDDGGGRLMVTDPLPAGFEIDNPNLIRSGDVDALDWLDATQDTDMVEFLQDRFSAAVTIQEKTDFRLAYIVRAVTPGQYRHPAASVEDMYRPGRSAWTNGGRVTVAQ